MKVFRYLVFICVCLFVCQGCDHLDEDNHTTEPYNPEIDVILDSLEQAMEDWDEDYLHDKLLTDPKISDLSINGNSEQRYHLTFIMGQYYLNMGLYETAIDKLLPVSKEIEKIDTPTKYQIYTLLERCYSYNSDGGNRASVLTNLSSKLDNTALGDSVTAWVQYMFASYYNSIGNASQRKIHLDEAKVYIEKWNIHDLRLMSGLLPYIRANPKTLKEKKKFLL